MAAIESKNVTLFSCPPGWQIESSCGWVMRKADNYEGAIKGLRREGAKQGDGTANWIVSLQLSEAPGEAVAMGTAVVATEV